MSLFFIVTFQFLLCSFEESGLVVISWGEDLSFGLEQWGYFCGHGGDRPVWSWFCLRYRCPCGYDLTAGWGYVNLRPSLLVSNFFALLNFFLSFSSSSSWPIPSSSYSLHKSEAASPSVHFKSPRWCLFFFAVPQEAASSHCSGAKSLNTCLCEAFSDTRRHKEKCRMQRCLKSTLGRGRTYLLENSNPLWYLHTLWWLTQFNTGSTFVKCGKRLRLCTLHKNFAENTLQKKKAKNAKKEDKTDKLGQKFPNEIK